ncbi:zinc-binding alcohol dehydrogenase family protein [Sodalis sp. RH16]|uniref:zinc-binding alcohol dehydrogenase family protein n=1 Tax=unclassified Sodalis (in: enterobacteria) TaxID=2636512 RepID=UPI0039B6ADA1
MKALIIDRNSQTRFDDIPEPSIKEGEVLVSVEYVGLCGSDLNTWRGLNPLVVYPCLPGHEIGGTVMQVAEDVTKCQVGDRVTILPYTACGECSSCKKGRPNACKYNQTLGVQRQGGMVRKLAVPFQKALVCNQLNSRQLALIEPLSVGLHAARRGAINVGEWVVIIGCGVIGLGTIAAAAAMGARVIAVDIDDRKEAVALACGATRFINSSKSDLVEIAGGLDEGRGPSLVIEAVGLSSTIELAVDLVAFAGRIVYVGYAKKPVTFDSAIFLLKELDIRGSRGATEADFRAVIALMEQNRYPVELLISAYYPLGKADRALEHWASDPGAVTKILVELQSE